MKKKKIAVIFGGHSSEYGVSLQSVYSVMTNIDTERFEIIPIGITKDGDWFHYTGLYENVRDDIWCCDADNLYPVVFSQNSV